ncbi:hypothetical protein B4U80_02330, partial [Leptotrombidium deliense]
EPEQQTRNQQAEQQLQFVPEPQKDFEVDSIVNLYPKESFDDSEHDLYEVVWKSCWVHANDLHMCKHRAIRDFFNTERGILMKAYEALLRQIPGVSSDIENWRISAFQIDQADKQDGPDYSRFKGLNEEEREKLYSKEVFNENLRLKHYIDTGFCLPSTSENTSSSFLSIELPSFRHSSESIDVLNPTNNCNDSTVSEEHCTANDNQLSEVDYNLNVDTVDGSVNEETNANGTAPNEQNENETSENSVISNFCFNANYNPSVEENNTEEVDSIFESINEVVTNYTLAVSNSQTIPTVATTTIEVAMDSEEECVLLDSASNPVMLPSCFKCGDCGKQFEKMSSLRKHSACHKERVNCDQCSKSFSKLDNLKRHKETHTEKLKCRVCKAGPFSCVFALNRHKQTHSINRYECNCGSSFNRIDNLKKHKKKFNH